MTVMSQGRDHENVANDNYDLSWLNVIRMPPKMDKIPTQTEDWLSMLKEFNNVLSFDPFEELSPEEIDWSNCTEIINSGWAKEWKGEEWRSRLCAKQINWYPDPQASATTPNAATTRFLLAMCSRRVVKETQKTPKGKRWVAAGGDVTAAFLNAPSE